MDESTYDLHCKLTCTNISVKPVVQIKISVTKDSFLASLDKPRGDDDVS